MQLNINWLARELRMGPLQEEQKAALESAFETEFIAQGIPIIHQYTSVHYLYILHSGSLRVRMKSHSRVITLNSDFHNRTFGEISFFGDEPAVADVFAEQPCEVYKISRDQFQWLMQNHAELAMKLMAYVLRSMGEIIRSMDSSRH